MRVLLTNHFPFHGSGTGTYTHDLASGLVAAGHEVHVLLVDYRRHEDDRFPTRRVICHASDAQADLHFDFPCFTSHPHSQQTYSGLSDQQIDDYRDALRQALDEEICQFDPQLIHAQHIWIMGHLALEAGLPYVLTAQGTDLMGYESDPRYRRWAHEAAENASRIIAPNAYIADHVRQLFGDLEGRVVIVPSAIDTQPYRQPALSREQALAQLGLRLPSGPVVAYVGKLAHFKGVDTLLAAAAIYASKIPQVATLIVGDGDQRSALARQAASLSNLHFLGDRSRHDCALVYQLADVVAMPSRGEPFGLVALEAMASGTPLIATKAGGLDELVSNDVGALVPVDDPQALATAIERALAEDWKRTKGPRARQYVEQHYGSQAWIERITNLYRQVLVERWGHF